ncbi:hypothetical protein [Pseudonocardia endophytica]|uniref:Cupin domain n=1 Tax=Pseudonocardia endophytica TaxID=401976 RepID=A0A4R1IAF4_PSEEN|nr:hypothetical protein [Pseudonocardia endophytica]TCK27312.1 hypothetical protein EV378_3180 [Pseudonocardia endophytica]
MPTYNTAMQRRSFADIPSDVHGQISKRTAEMDGAAVTEVTFEPGSLWSKDLKPDAGTELCELPHVAVVVNGALGVRMQDGTQGIFRAGDVMMLPPGHDAWCVGDEPCIFVEFSRGNDYYT